MRFAQYGISHDHAAGKARVIRESAQAELAGVYEPSPQVRDALGSDPAYAGVHWFSSKEEMLEDEGIIAIAVEGEIFQNVGFAREAVEHGKHVWLDKPAGDDLEAFREVVEIARERGLMVQLSYMWRYHPGFRFIMEWARSGRLGDIFSIRGRISSWPGSEDRWKLWESRGVRAGGIMFIVGCHLIDIIVAILGRPRRVTRFSRHDGGDPPLVPGQHRGGVRVPRRHGDGGVGLHGSLLGGVAPPGGVRHPAAAPSWSRSSRPRCACAWTATATATPRAGRR